MKLSRLQEARREAERFIALANKLERADDMTGGSSISQRLYGLPRESGAVRRASMDLTRSLANLRRSD